MTAEAADRRIMRSRRTLAAYGRMGLPEDDRHMVIEEIAILGDLARQHPEKAAKIEALCARLRALAGTVALN